MAAPNTTSVDQKVDQEIFTDTSVNGPKPNAAAFRRTFKFLSAWVVTMIVDAMPWRRVTDSKGSVEEADTVYRTGRTIVGRAQDDGTNSALQASSFSADSVKADRAAFTSLNGLGLNRDVGIIPAGTATFRYFRIAQFLATDNSASRDTLRILACFGGWGSSERTVIDLTLSNRNGINQYTTITGNPGSQGFVAYRQNDGSLFFYLRLNNDYRCASISIIQATQVTLFAQWSQDEPTGTIVYDSTNISSFPPALFLGPTVTSVTGYLRTGYANKAFQLTGVKAGSNLTINPNQYLELKLDDGTVLKAALLN